MSSTSRLIRGRVWRTANVAILTLGLVAVFWIFQADTAKAGCDPVKWSGGSFTTGEAYCGWGLSGAQSGSGGSSFEFGSSAGTGSQDGHIWVNDSYGWYSQSGVETNAAGKILQISASANFSEAFNRIYGQTYIKFGFTAPNPAASAENTSFNLAYHECGEVVKGFGQAYIPGGLVAGQNGVPAEGVLMNRIDVLYNNETSCPDNGPPYNVAPNAQIGLTVSRTDHSTLVCNLEGKPGVTSAVLAAGDRPIITCTGLNQNEYDAFSSTSGNTYGSVVDKPESLIGPFFTNNCSSAGCTDTSTGGFVTSARLKLFQLIEPTPGTPGGVIDVEVVATPIYGATFVKKVRFQFRYAVPPPLSPPEAFNLSDPVPSCENYLIHPNITLTWTKSANATEYNVYQDGVLAYPNVSSPFPIAVNNGSTHTYRVEATNASGTVTDTATPVTSVGVTNSNPPGSKTINLKEAWPQGCGNLKLSISPPPLPLRLFKMDPLASQLFAAIVSMDTAPPFIAKAVKPGDPSAGLTVTWPQPENTDAGSIQPGSDQLHIIFKAGSILGTYPKAVRATAHYVAKDGIAQPDASDAIDIVLANRSATISGDVFGAGGVNGIIVDANSVVSAKKEVVVSGSVLTIPNYSPSNSLDWDTARTKILSKADELLNEQLLEGHQLSKGNDPLALGQVGAPTSINLNPKTSAGFSTSTETNDAFKEGQVWYVGGDLTIRGNATFYGRGTIIVDGNVTITDGSISYGDTASSLGIIVRRDKSLTITPTVSSMVGAYFVSGSITFEQGASQSAFVAEGIFVGNSISLKREFASITYDSTISKIPPPGFGVVSLPVVQ